MAEQKHWKAFEDPEYLGSWFFKPNQEIVLTISDVVRKEVKNDKGKKDVCTVATFKEPGVKPMIINPTNAKTISKIYGSPYLSDWVGKKIQLYVQKNVEAFGERVDAVRIRPASPELPFLTPEHPKWLKVVEKVRSGSSLEAVKNSFQIRPEHEKMLISIKQ